MTKKSPLTDEQHEQVTRYMRKLADLMNLKDWDLEISRERPCSSDAYAEISLHTQKLQGWIYLDPGWPERTPEGRRETMVHELLHVHTGRMRREYRAIAGHLTKDLGHYAARLFGVEEEILVSSLARIIAPTMPLPDQD